MKAQKKQQQQQQQKQIWFVFVKSTQCWILVVISLALQMKH
jgi:hypothetical protein